jgi:hypothetical protein
MEVLFMRFADNMRQAATGLIAALGVVLAGCSSIPIETPMGLSDKPAAQFNTGSVTLYVTDYAGQPLRQAWVDIESNAPPDKEYFRNAAVTDHWGRVTFRGVPEQIRISVNHTETRAYYSRPFEIPSSGNTELRMMLETQPVEPRPVPQPVPMPRPVPTPQ